MATRVPEPERPRMAAGYTTPRLLPWRWVTSRMEAARNYWIASTRRDGRPHVRPVWGVWLDERFYFSTGGLTGRNLDRSDEVSVNLESGDETVILEGTARRVTDAAEQQRFVGAYNPKYDWDMQPDPNIWAVEPRVVFAWLSDGSGSDRGTAFSHTSTCWRFGADAD